MGDYEAAFSDDEEGAKGEEQGSAGFASACAIPTAALEDTGEAEDDSPGSYQRTSESSAGDSGSESASRPLSPPLVSTQYYYFYQGKLKMCLLSLLLYLQDYSGLSYTVAPPPISSHQKCKAKVVTYKRSNHRVLNFEL